MKLRLILGLVAATACWAQSDADQTTFGGVIQGLLSGDGVKPFDGRPESAAALRQVIAVRDQAAAAARESMSERTGPITVIDSVQYLTPDLASVKAAEVVAGSLVFGRAEFVLILERHGGSGGDWQPIAVRTTGNWSVAAGYPNLPLPSVTILTR